MVERPCLRRPCDYVGQEQRPGAWLKPRGKAGEGGRTKGSPRTTKFSNCVHPSRDILEFQELLNESLMWRFDYSKPLKWRKGGHAKLKAQQDRVSTARLLHLSNKPFGNADDQ
ncbi:hypothetical protein ZWY2020_015475 [Hordeum vulgare]|nr:hypothetical protein ZWY2020_015475 [Hordeum vulgare]